MDVKRLRRSDQNCRVFKNIIINIRTFPPVIYSSGRNDVGTRNADLLDNLWEILTPSSDKSSGLFKKAELWEELKMFGKKLCMTHVQKLIESRHRRRAAVIKHKGMEQQEMNQT